jgi:hypothetical protein
MATLEEANEAREKHSNYLHQVGAHAIGVDEIIHEGSQTFGVIAYFESEPNDAIPDTLEIDQQGTTKRVPLTTVITSRASLE